MLSSFSSQKYQNNFYSQFYFDSINKRLDFPRKPYLKENEKKRPRMIWIYEKFTAVLRVYLGKFIIVENIKYLIVKII